MMFRSTTPLPFAGIRRLPSIRTSVEPAAETSQLRRCPGRHSTPCPTCSVYAGTNCGSVLSVVSTVIDPVRSKSSCVTETIGLADSKSAAQSAYP